MAEKRKKFTCNTEDAKESTSEVLINECVKSIKQTKEWVCGLSILLFSPLSVLRCGKLKFNRERADHSSDAYGRRNEIVDRLIAEYNLKKQ